MPHTVYTYVEKFSHSVQKYQKPYTPIHYVFVVRMNMNSGNIRIRIISICEPRTMHYRLCQNRHISNITNPKKSKISYVRESSLDYEDPGLSFKCNDNNKSTLLIDVTLNMAQGRIQNMSLNPY